MKNTAFILVLVLITIMSGYCQSNRNNPKKGLLWEISGNKLTEKSYLFGTWHGSTGICIDFLDSIPNFHKVFNSTSQFVGETLGGKDVVEALQEPLGEVWMPQNTKYHDLLNKADVQLLDSLLLKNIGTTSSEVNVRPNHLCFILMTILSQKPYLEAENEKCKVVMDSYLQVKAKEKNDSLVGLDSPEILKKTSSWLYLKDYDPEMTLKENADWLIRQIREYLPLENNTDLKINMRKLEDAYRDMDLKDLINVKHETIEITKKISDNSEFRF